MGFEDHKSGCVCVECEDEASVPKCADCGGDHIDRMTWPCIRSLASRLSAIEARVEAHIEAHPALSVPPVDDSAVYVPVPPGSTFRMTPDQFDRLLANSLSPPTHDEVRAVVLPLLGAPRHGLSRSFLVSYIGANEARDAPAPAAPPVERAESRDLPSYGFRCMYEDHSGQCTSDATRCYRVDGRASQRCDKHRPAPAAPAVEPAPANTYPCGTCGKALDVGRDGETLEVNCSECEKQSRVEPAPAEKPHSPAVCSHPSRDGAGTCHTCGHWDCKQDPCSGTHDPPNQHRPRDTKGATWIGRTDWDGTKLEPEPVSRFEAEGELIEQHPIGAGHAAKMGVFAAPPEKPGRVCEAWCGLLYAHRDVPCPEGQASWMDDVDAGRDYGPPYVENRDKPADPDTCNAFCSAACARAGRPLNPAPDPASASAADGCNPGADGVCESMHNCPAVADAPARDGEAVIDRLNGDDVRDSIRQIESLRAELATARAAEKAQGEELKRLKRDVVANAGRLAKVPRERWGHVMDATGLGSTSAWAMCVDAGFDPQEEVPAEERREESDEDEEEDAQPAQSPAPTALAKLDELATLQPNWDSYGAKPIDPRAIEAVRRHITSLHVSPLPGGGVQVESSASGVEVAFRPDGSVETEEDRMPAPAPTGGNLETAGLWLQEGGLPLSHRIALAGLLDAAEQRGAAKALDHEAIKAWRALSQDDRQAAVDDITTRIHVLRDSLAHTSQFRELYGRMTDALGVAARALAALSGDGEAGR